MVGSEVPVDGLRTHFCEQRHRTEVAVVSQYDRCGKRDFGTIRAV